MRGGHDIFPIWIFFQASEAVNIQESMIPATVNVPPTMAQIYKEHIRVSLSVLWSSALQSRPSMSWKPAKCF